MPELFPLALDHWSQDRRVRVLLVRHSSGGGGVMAWPYTRSEIKRLDDLSRTRALTLAESIMLERLLWRVEKKSNRRAPYGTMKELARAGIKRSQVQA